MSKPTCSAPGSRAGACGNPTVQSPNPCLSFSRRDRTPLSQQNLPRSHQYSWFPSGIRIAPVLSHPLRSLSYLQDGSMVGDWTLLVLTTTRYYREYFVLLEGMSTSPSKENKPFIPPSLDHLFVRPSSLEIPTMVEAKEIGATLEHRFFILRELWQTISTSLPHNIWLYNIQYTYRRQR